MLSVFHDDSIGQIWMPPTNRRMVIELCDPDIYARQSTAVSEQTAHIPTLFIAVSGVAPSGEYDWTRTSLLSHSLRTNNASTTTSARRDFRDKWCKFSLVEEGCG